jgi:hypothetical protein
LLDQELGGHPAKTIGRAGYEHARHSKSCRSLREQDGI